MKDCVNIIDDSLIFVALNSKNLIVINLCFWGNDKLLMTDASLRYIKK